MFLAFILVFFSAPVFGYIYLVSLAALSVASRNPSLLADSFHRILSEFPATYFLGLFITLPVSVPSVLFIVLLFDKSPKLFNGIKLSVLLPICAAIPTTIFLIVASFGFTFGSNLAEFLIFPFTGACSGYLYWLTAWAPYSRRNNKPSSPT